MRNFVGIGRLDHCLLVVTALKQLMENSGPLLTPAEVEYAEKLTGFFRYTMDTCIQLDAAPHLTLVE